MSCTYEEKECSRRGTPDCNYRCQFDTGYSLIREIVKCTREVPCLGLCNPTCAYHQDYPGNEQKPTQRAVSPDRTGRVPLDWRGLDPTLRKGKRRCEFSKNTD